MSSESGEQDKQYEASHKKLEDARKKGDVPKSIDLTTAAAYAGFLVASMFLGPAAVVGVSADISGLIARADSISESVFGGNGSPILGAVFSSTSKGVALWALIPGAFALLAIVGQRGLVFAPSKLTPKLSRVSLLSGARNKFGRDGLFEFFKSTAKLCIYSLVLAVFLTRQFPSIMETLRLSPANIATCFLSMTLQLMFIVLIVSLVLGIIDLVWQVSQHQRKNRMSRKELTDEQKDSEGDPMIKHQRRQKAVSIAMNQMLADVPDSDVVIVNPKHYAVALKWDRSKARAPVCVAKGVDEVAARIREISIANSIAIHSDPATARALFATVEIGEEIRPDHYRAVAAAVRFADAMRKRVKYS